MRLQERWMVDEVSLAQSQFMPVIPELLLTVLLLNFESVPGFLDNKLFATFIISHK